MDSKPTAPYRIEVRRYDSATLPHVALTVLLTMEGSARRAHYLAQLKRAPPSRRVAIVHNRGYKVVPKPGVKSSVQDLWHANRFIFALTAAVAGPVLVLEDDYEMGPLSPEQARLVAQSSAACDALFLGCLPLISWSDGSGRASDRIRMGGLAHAVIYSRAARRRLLPLTLPSIAGMVMPHDLFVIVTLTCRAMRRPLAFQKHARTANSVTWDPCALVYRYFRAWRADTDPVPMTRFHHRVGAVGGLLPLLGALVLVVHQTVRLIGRNDSRPPRESQS